MHHLCRKQLRWCGGLGANQEAQRLFCQDQSTGLAAPTDWWLQLRCELQAAQVKALRLQPLQQSSVGGRLHLGHAR